MVRREALPRRADRTLSDYVFCDKVSSRDRYCHRENSNRDGKALKKMLKERFREIEKRLLSESKAFYGERLVSLVVFGSVARDAQRFDSDLDLLVIAEGLPKGRVKRIGEFEVVEERLAPFLKSLEQNHGINTYISAMIKSPEEAEKGSFLFLDMVEDARILFDRDGFFTRRLDRLRKRLKELGAKRIWRGNAWYWDLKPDYKPGDIIEL